MSGFLDIPRELRDIIITLLLTTAPATQKPVATSLFLTNQQIRSETQDALSRLPGNGRCYAVDITFPPVEEEEIKAMGHFQATFTLLPVFAYNVDTLEVNVRMGGGKNIDR